MRCSFILKIAGIGSSGHLPTCYRTRRNIRSSLKCPSDPTNTYIFIYLHGCFAAFSLLLISACVVHKNEQRKERTGEENKERDSGGRNYTPF